jgi:hypothetical protein
VAAAALVATLAAWAPPAAGAQATPAALTGPAAPAGARVAARGHLPAALPAPSVLRASPKRVFAHYMPSLPISIDNRPPKADYYSDQYLSPAGESGKHRAYGGFVRDRPLPRDPLASPDWMLRDLETEVRQAVAAGVDGFSLDLLHLADTPGNGVLWRRTNLMLAAAQNVDPGFTIMLMPDMAAIGHRDVDALARSVAELAAYRSAFRLADGRLVVSPFYAERRPVSWWTEFIGLMKRRHGIDVAFVPVLLDVGRAAAFAPISYGLSEWGTRNPVWNDPLATRPGSPVGRISQVHKLGKLWMQPVSVQDERPRSGVYQEAANTANLRNTWQIALRGAAEWVHLLTWNDYAEGTHFAPSVRHGWSYLDISAYYLAWFKTGAPPTIAQDTLYLTHRSQPVTARPRFPQTHLMALRGGTPARDTAEVLAFLTRPATVTLTSGSATTTCAAPAGLSTCTVPLRPGRVGVVAARGATAVAGLTSPFAVTATPWVQDLQYLAVGSRGPRWRAVPAG